MSQNTVVDFVQPLLPEQLHHQKPAFLLRIVFGHGARGEGDALW